LGLGLRKALILLNFSSNYRAITIRVPTSLYKELIALLRYHYFPKYHLEKTSSKPMKATRSDHRKKFLKRTSIFCLPCLNQVATQTRTKQTQPPQCRLLLQINWSQGIVY